MMIMMRGSKQKNWADIIYEQPLMMLMRNILQVTGEARTEIVDDTPLLINIKAST